MLLGKLGQPIAFRLCNARGHVGATQLEHLKGAGVCSVRCGHHQEQWIASPVPGAQLLLDRFGIEAQVRAAELRQHLVEKLGPVFNGGDGGQRDRCWWVQQILQRRIVPSASIEQVVHPALRHVGLALQQQDAQRMRRKPVRFTLSEFEQPVFQPMGMGAGVVDDHQRRVAPAPGAQGRLGEETCQLPRRGKTRLPALRRPAFAEFKRQPRLAAATRPSEHAHRDGPIGCLDELVERVQFIFAPAQGRGAAIG